MEALCSGVVAGGAGGGHGSPSDGSGRGAEMLAGR